MLCIGLMSGTSMDGVDAALVAFEDSRWRTCAFVQRAWPAGLREQLAVALTADAALGLGALGELDVACGRVFASAAHAVIVAAGVEAKDIAAVGSHGQTIMHRPDARYPCTLQIGDPNTIAALTGVVTIADFRRMDLALGGQGAPLAPGFHQYAWRESGRTRAVLNLGGIANVTVLPANPEQPVLGFDTGPGNGLLDQWAQRHLGTAYDHDGAWGASGQSDARLLEALLADPYFARPAPKSTGRDYFNQEWLNRSLQRVAVLSPADVQATLLTLTAQSIGSALRQTEIRADEVIVCGGGARNKALMGRLASTLEPAAVVSSSARGLDPDAVEAVAFAWLAAQRLLGRPGNLPSVTGAKRAVPLGAIYLP